MANNLDHGLLNFGMARKFRYLQAEQFLLSLVHAHFLSFLPTNSHSQITHIVIHNFGWYFNDANTYFGGFPNLYQPLFQTTTSFNDFAVCGKLSVVGCDVQRITNRTDFLATEIDAITLLKKIWLN